MVYQVPVAFTGLLKVTARLVVVATCVASSTGVVAVTDRRGVGAEGEHVVRGHGVGRVAGVLVGDLGGENRHGAALAGGEIGVGLSVKVVGPPETTAVCAPLVAQTMVNQVPVTSTGSEKVMVTSVLAATSSAPFVGVVAATARRGVGDEVEDEVGEHGVERVVAVLVGDLGGDDGHGAGLVDREVAVRVEREGGRAARDRRRCGCRWSRTQW